MRRQPKLNGWTLMSFLFGFTLLVFSAIELLLCILCALMLMSWRLMHFQMMLSIRLKISINNVCTPFAFLLKNIAYRISFVLHLPAAATSSRRTASPSSSWTRHRHRYRSVVGLLVLRYRPMRHPPHHYLPLASRYVHRLPCLPFPTPSARVRISTLSIAELPNLPPPQTTSPSLIPISILSLSLYTCSSPSSLFSLLSFLRSYTTRDPNNNNNNNNNNFCFCFLSFFLVLLSLRFALCSWLFALLGLCSRFSGTFGDATVVL